MGALSNDSIIAATLIDGNGTAPEVESAATPVRGHAIGRYLLLSQLGAGAMGIVYAAYDPELDRKVALKLLKHHGGDVAASRKRLQREAQALAKLDHPNVVSVHDVGVHKDRLFVAMEYVAGKTLGSWMAEAKALPTASGRRPSAGPEQVLRARPWREVLEVFMQAGRGLAAAHEAGLVHRDFKPDNVMLNADGRVRVMDFGLARGDGGEATARGDAVERTVRGAAPVLSGLTQVGAIIGTPAYMSLEQFEARDVDARSDQFSFCVALYEALYGERPFTGDTIAALTEALRAEAIREAPRGNVVPGWVRAVVLRGLARAPEARFGSMEALLDALAADPAARRRRRLFGAGLALAMVLSAWGIVKLVIRIGQSEAVIAEQASEIDEKNAALREQLAAQTRLLSVQRGLRAKALIPENREAEALLLGVQAVGAYAHAWTDVPREALEGLEQVLAHDTVVITDERVLAGHSDYLTGIAYTPDGERLVTNSLDGTARIWDVDAGAPVAVLAGDDGSLFAAGFSPDGARVATAGEGRSARIWDAATGEAIARCDGHTARILQLAFSPDGRRLATAGLDRTARICDAATGAPLVALEGHREDGILDVAFAPDGARVATAGRDATARLWDSTTGALLATLVGHGGPINALEFSPDGARLATASVDHDARTWDVATGALVAVLKGDDQRVMNLRYAPGGARLVTIGWSPTARVFDPESGALVRELKGGHGAGIMDLAFSPDGARLVTSSYDGSVVVWDPESGAQVERLVGHQADVWGVAFSPDGRHVATAGVDSTARVWELFSPRLAVREGPENDVRAADFSPDGAHLVTVARGRQARLWQTEGVRLVAALGDADRATFAPDGRHVATLGDGEIHLWDALTGAPRATLPAPGARMFSYSPDGVFLHAASDSSGAMIEVESGERVESPGFADTQGCFTQGGRRFVGVGEDLVVRIWDPRTGALLAAIDKLGAAPRYARCSPDGDRIATTSSQEEGVRIWDAETYALVATCNKGRGTLRELAFSPDSARLMAIHDGLGAYVWEPDTCRLLGRYEPDDQNPKTGSGLFSPDGAHIALISDRVVRLLDGETYAILRDLDGHGDTVRRLWFSVDGARLTTLSGGTLREWDVESGELLSRERIGLVRGDGSIDWPVDPGELTRIGCERLRMHGRVHEEARAICAPLFGAATVASRRR